ncbi:type II toxin-antitoxin system RelE/ParE family toxin [Chitinophaga sp. GCM10012297]|uniref:Type II toxin-antitoxin system RelE/ParE family toxin n=1 Tax=Chitinophaga chungangae TaxID=2821488 RepID=A0ABS3YJS2_9BACT|nr:type II toxin-antitoxin system RelE/ParE family toxin [Chitinophaga chungangae]MBO9154926.1 type II toxin-antitoxin system RelE/ParE family toxin [Chitinophaga chungangae]
MVTVWTPKASVELNKAFKYINQDSPANARKVISTILDIADKIALQPEMFPVDKYKKNNDGTWRAFEKYRYRISYHITKDVIHIIRMRHTSQSPLHY